MKDKTIVITGGTQGLGAELAKRLEDVGAEVIIIARRRESFGKMGLKNASFYEADISDRVQVEGFVNELHGKTVDVLLNVAGAWTDDEIESRKPEQRELAINTNALGTINITDALLPNLKQSDSAQILFVVSNSGYLGLGGDTSGDWPSYNASKWAERGYAFALRNKIQESGDRIKIGAVYPGGFTGELFTNADRAGENDDQPWMMKVETVANTVMFMLNQPTDANIDELVITKHF